MFSQRLQRYFPIALLLLFPGLALAQGVYPDDTAATADEETVSKLPEGFSFTFLFICSALIFIMQAGFCLLEMGFSRSKNTINIVMKNILDFGAGTIGFFLIGFSLMFGTSQGGIVGWDNFGFDAQFSGGHEIWIFWVFQMMFATAAVTISSGAMAERTFFPGYLVYAFFATCVIYPILGHWVWGGASVDFGFGGGEGWLAKLGFLDFAGSTVVHSVGGAFALAGILAVGPRKGRFTADGEARVFPGHSAPLSALGFFLLFFGWFGFNAGSNIVPTSEIGRQVAVTVLAAASGLLGALLTHWLRKGWADMEVSLNGLLGGLVASTASCAFIAPWAGVVTGFIAGVIVASGGELLLKLRRDDAVGAVPVHLFCGIWGTLCVSIFNDKTPFANIGVQALGAIVVPIAAFCSSYLLFKIVGALIGLRASDDAQEMGLDFAEHSATAYPDFVTTEADEI